MSYFLMLMSALLWSLVAFSKASCKTRATGPAWPAARANVAAEQQRDRSGRLHVPIRPAPWSDVVWTGCARRTICDTAGRRRLPHRAQLTSRRDLHLDALTPQLPKQPGLDPRGYFHHAVHLGFLHHLRVAVQRGEQLPIPHRHPDPGHRTERLGRGPQRAAQFLDTQTRSGTRNGGGQHRVRIALPHLGEKCLRVREEIRFVEDVDHPLAVGTATAVPRSAFRVPHFALHDLHLLLPRRMPRVDHVQQQVRRARFLEGRAERGNEVVRQLADEADGVGETKPVSVADIHLAGQGVERREQAILDEDVVARERAQDARLSSVGVAHERRARAGAPSLALVRAVVGYVVQPLFEDGDLAADGPAVGLKLGLARPAQPDATTDAGEVRPHAGEPGQEVLELRQLHLQLRLGRARARREDVEDDLGAVHHPHREHLLEVRSLYRRQRLVEQHQRGAHAVEHTLQLLDLALPEVEVGCGSLDSLVGPPDDRSAGRVRQPSQPVQVLLHLRRLAGALPRRTDEERALGRWLYFDQRSDAATLRSWQGFASKNTNAAASRKWEVGGWATHPTQPAA